MTRTANWPRFAAALVVFQVIVQIVAWGIGRLQTLEMPLPFTAETAQVILLAGLALVAVVAVAGSAWLGTRSRKAGEGMGWLVWAAGGWFLAAGLLLEHVVFPLWDFEAYPASLVLWIYAKNTLNGLIWSSASAALSLRLWACVALAFNAAMAMMYATPVSRTDASAAAYGWDRDSHLLAQWLNGAGLVSLGLMLLALLAIGWGAWRRRNALMARGHKGGHPR